MPVPTPTRRLLVLALTAVLAACAGAPPSTAPSTSTAASPTAAADDPVFLGWYRNLEDELKADPYHKPIPVRGATANQAFLEQVHAAYRKRITPDALRQWINDRYPGQRYETEFIVTRLPR